MMLTMQGIGYIRGEKQVTKNGYYKVNISCRGNKEQWIYITVIYGESFNKYPMQYVKEGDVIYFEVKDVKIDVKGDRYYISGFAINMSTATSRATQTSHTAQGDDIYDDSDNFGDSEVDDVPF